MSPAIPAVVRRSALLRSYYYSSSRSTVKNRSALATTGCCPHRPSVLEAAANLTSSSTTYTNSRSLLRQQMSSFHFASGDYASCFAGLPAADPDELRRQALRYVREEFRPTTWHDDPVVSLLDGSPLLKASASSSSSSDESPPREVIDTRNALGTVNGRQVLASKADLDKIAHHLLGYSDHPPHDNNHDFRDTIRKIEFELLTTSAGFLIGNQLVDFAKQDGVTEIVEAIQANSVERQLNDALLRDEAAGQIVVNRQPIYVSCVSNFTNFLDLSRKTLRSLEVGIPCVVLGRTGGNTVQHSYRWVQLLGQLMHQQGVDAGMLTYVSATLSDLQTLIRRCNPRTGLLYATSSRATALSMTQTYREGNDHDGPVGVGKVVASTGGPNTMVVLHPDTLADPRVQKAIQTSATIECAGQCTALRHCVIPTDKVSDGEDSLGRVESVVSHVWDGVPALPDSELDKALQESVFDGVYVGHQGSAEPAIDENPPYVRRGDAWYRVSHALPPSPSKDGPTLNEYWRKAVVDFTQLDCSDPAQVHQLANWLNESQPISLAVNGPRAQAITSGLELFRSTALVVYTIGSHDDPAMPPALTCQARPQEGEVFGEFPPRNSLNSYTRFPVFIPSSNPSYDAHYTKEYLASQGATASEDPGTGWTCNKSTRELIGAVSDPQVRGYCVLLLKYLQDVCRMNPKMGVPTSPASRTALWGLQRPPVGWTTVLRIKDNSSLTWNDVVPVYLLFHATNAQSQVQLSFSPSCHSSILDVCKAHRLPHVVEDEAQREHRLAQSPNVFHVAELSRMTTFTMVDHFVSLYFPLGHIKSTRPGDEEFLLRARLSHKWLNTNF